MRIRYDFTAPAGTHFGIIRSLEEIIADIASPVDRWLAQPADVTQIDGRMSAWTGRLGRQFVQANAAKRPVYTGNGVRFMDSATNAPNSYMTLSGAQIGSQPSLTIASRIRLHSSTLTTDLHYFWGHSAPICRLTYRYTAANNYLRMQIGASNLDLDIPPGQADLGVVLVCSAATATLHVAGGGSASGAIAAAPDLQGLLIGGAVHTGGTQEDLPGWITRFGLWTSAAAGNDLAALLDWVA